MNILLLLYAIAAISYGVVAVLFPGFLIPLLWNTPPGPEADMLLQGWGSALLGFGTLAMLARNLDKTGQRTVVTGILIYFAGAMITWILDSVGRGWTLFGAISFATYLIFAVPFVYLAFLRKSEP
jgi:hypothetical protein